MPIENTMPALISPKEAAALTTMSKVHIANMARQGLFPAAVQISEKRTAYVREEVQQFLNERIASRTTLKSWTASLEAESGVSA